MSSVYGRVGLCVRVCVYTCGRAGGARGTGSSVPIHFTEDPYILGVDSYQRDLTAWLGYFSHTFYSGATPNIWGHTFGTGPSPPYIFYSSSVQVGAKTTSSCEGLSQS